MMPKMPQVKYDLIKLNGGWDLITPTLSLNPGYVRDAINFECSQTGGYSRIEGYERFDGRSKPSDAQYIVFAIASFTTVPVIGDVVTNQTGTPTAKVIAVTSTYIVVTKVVGTFSEGDTIKVGASVVGTYSILSDLITSKVDAQYLALAAEQYRTDIQPITGSGPIRGVVAFNDIVYALRDNAGGTAVNLWKSSSSGWVQINFEYEVSFTAGTTVPADGATLTKGGVTATVRRVMTESGAWTGTAAGRFIISVPSGGNFSAGAATLTGGSTVTLSGIQTAITLTPGGKFEFIQANFYGRASSLRLYWADGVNRCCEFDGTYVVPITTGTNPDQPKHIAAHKNHLFLSFGSSLIHSGIGEPYKWQTIDGAGEIATGDTITNLMPQPGSQASGAMAVYCRSNTFILYGTSTSDWNFVQFNSGTGAFDYTIQNMKDTYVLDDRGVSSLQTTLNYGNFDSATLTNNIKTFVIDKRSKIACASLNREKSQYRLFFSDGYGLYMSIVNGQLIGSMPVLFPNPAYCAFEGEMTDGNEITLFGSASGGYVYQLDKGPSFDGNAIEGLLTFNWNAIGSPRILKRFRKASLETSGNAYANVAFGYQLGYGTEEIYQPNNVSYDAQFQGLPRWDSFVWDQFVWDGRTLMPTDCEMTGTANNVQITITASTNYIKSFTLNSIILHYSHRRGMR